MGAGRSVHIRGDVVTRPRNPWTPTVHSLPAHLYHRGMPVPEPLGYDESHEQVRLVPGDAGDDAWPHQLVAPGLTGCQLFAWQKRLAS